MLNVKVLRYETSSNEWCDRYVRASNCSADSGIIDLRPAGSDAGIAVSCGDTIALRDTAVWRSSTGHLFGRALGGAVFCVTGEGVYKVPLAHLLTRDWQTHDVGAVVLQVSNAEGEAKTDGPLESAPAAQAAFRRSASEAAMLSKTLHQTSVVFEQSLCRNYADQMEDLSCSTLNTSPCGESRPAAATAAQIAVTNYPASYFAAGRPSKPDIRSLTALVEGTLMAEGENPREATRAQLVNRERPLLFDVLRYATSQVQYLPDQIRLNNRDSTAESWMHPFSLNPMPTGEIVFTAGDCEDGTKNASDIVLALQQLDASAAGSIPLGVAADQAKQYIPFHTTMSANTASAGDEEAVKRNGHQPKVAHLACCLIKPSTVMAALRNSADSYAQCSDRGNPRTCVASATEGIVTHPLAYGVGTSVELLLPESFKRVPADVANSDTLPSRVMIECTCDLSLQSTGSQSNEGDIMKKKGRDFALSCDRSAFPVNSEGNLGPLMATSPIQLYQEHVVTEGSAGGANEAQVCTVGEAFPFWNKAQTMSMPAPISHSQQDGHAFDPDACGHPIIIVRRESGFGSSGVTECVVADFVIETGANFHTAVDVNGVLLGCSTTAQPAFALTPHQGISAQRTDEWARCYKNRLPDGRPSLLEEVSVRVIRPASATPEATDFVCLMYSPASDPVHAFPQIWKAAAAAAERVMGLTEDHLRCVRVVTAAGDPTGDESKAWAQGRFEIGASRAAIIASAIRLVDEGKSPQESSVYGVDRSLAQIVADMRGETSIGRQAGGGTASRDAHHILHSHTSARPQMKRVASRSK